MRARKSHIRKRVWPVSRSIPSYAHKPYIQKWQMRVGKGADDSNLSRRLEHTRFYPIAKWKIQKRFQPIIY